MDFKIHEIGIVEANPHVFKLRGKNERGRAVFKVHPQEKQLELIQFLVLEGIDIFPKLSTQERIKIEAIIGKKYPWTDKRAANCKYPHCINYQKDATKYCCNGCAFDHADLDNC